MSFLLTSLLVFLCAFHVSAMHEDEAGKNDWHQVYIGQVSTIAISTSTKRPVVALGTIDSAVGTVNEVTGDLMWRRVLNKDTEIRSIAITDKYVGAIGSTLGVSSLYVFDILHGNLLVTESLPDISYIITSREDRFYVCGLESTNLRVFSYTGKDLADGNFDDTKATKYADFVEGQLFGSAELVCSAAQGKLTCFHIKSSSVVTLAIKGNIEGIHGSNVYFASSVARWKNSVLVEEAIDSTTKSVCYGRDGPVKILQIEQSGGPQYCKCGADSAVCIVKTLDGNIHRVDGGKKILWSRSEGLSAGKQALFVTPSEYSTLVVDRTIIIVGTSLGKVYAVQSEDGAVRWEKLFATTSTGVQKFLLLKGKDETVFAVWFSDSLTHIVGFDGVSGKVTFPVKTSSGDYIHVFVSENTCHVILESSTAVLTNGESKSPSPTRYVYASSPNGVKGYRVASGAVTTQWSLPTRLNETLVAVSRHAGAEEYMFADVFRILPDRKKNRNTVHMKHSMSRVVVYATINQATKTLNIFFVDGTSGSLIGHVQHEDAMEPVRLSVAEHFATYTYVVASKLINVIGIVELLHRSTVGSSAESDSLLENTYTTPTMVIKSFLISSAANVPPVHGHIPQLHNSLFYLPMMTQTMGMTKSKRGLTPKHVVLASLQGRILTVDVRALLNAPEGRTDIPILPQLFVSHRNIVSDPRYIATGSTFMESSCHVAVVGRDLWYSRLYPAKSYDTLNDDVNFNLLMGLLVLSIGGTLILRRYAKSKQMKILWA